MESGMGITGTVRNNASPGLRATVKTSWKRWQQLGREAQPRKKGQRDGVRTSLPSRTIFLWSGLGEVGLCLSCS